MKKRIKLTNRQKLALEECIAGVSYEETARKLTTPSNPWTAQKVVYFLADTLRRFAGDIKAGDLIDKHY